MTSWWSWWSIRAFFVVVCFEWRRYWRKDTKHRPNFDNKRNNSALSLERVGENGICDVRALQREWSWREGGIWKKSDKVNASEKFIHTFTKRTESWGSEFVDVPALAWNWVESKLIIYLLYSLCAMRYTLVFALQRNVVFDILQLGIHENG